LAFSLFCQTVATLLVKNPIAANIKGELSNAISQRKE